MVDLLSDYQFPGGDDVDPAYYGETPHEKLGEVGVQITAAMADGELFRQNSGGRRLDTSFTDAANYGD